VLYNKNETVRAAIDAMWEGIKNVIGAVVGWITGTAVPAIVGAWDRVTAADRALQASIKAVWDGFIRIVSNAVNAVKAQISRDFDQIKTYIINPITTAVQWVVDRLTWLYNVFASIGGGIRSVVSSSFGSVASIIGDKIGDAVDVVKSLPSRIMNALSGAGSWLKNAGQWIIQGLIDGIASWVPNLKGYLGNITSWITSWKGPPDKDKILLTDNGKLIMEGLITGLASQIGPLRSLLTGITNDIPNSFVASAVVQNQGAASQRLASIPQQGGGQPVTFNVYNPVEEPTSVTTTRTMTRAAQLGVLG
jgi:phage-related protein